MHYRCLPFVAYRFCFWRVLRHPSIITTTIRDIYFFFFCVCAVFSPSGDIWLNPAYRKSVAVQDVHFLLLGHLFGLGYRRVERRVDAGDTVARVELPVAGFRLEGVLRKHMVVKVREGGRKGGRAGLPLMLFLVFLFFFGAFDVLRGAWRACCAGAPIMVSVMC